VCAEYGYTGMQTMVLSDEDAVAVRIFLANVSEIEKREQI